MWMPNTCVCMAFNFTYVLAPSAHTLQYCKLLGVRNNCKWRFKQWFEKLINQSKFWLSSLTTGKFVIGRVIKAMQANWHPDCFRCEICNDGLADSGFVKNAGRWVCQNVTEMLSRGEGIPIYRYCILLHRDVPPDRVSFSGLSVLTGCTAWQPGKPLI